VSEKLCRKTLAQDVLDRNEVLMGYQCEIFNFVDLCSGVLDIVWCGRPQAKHDLMLPLLSLSPLNV